MYNNGLQQNSDVWVELYRRILPSSQVAAKFGLLPSESNHWETIRSRLTNTDTRLLWQQSLLPQPEEWLGLCPLVDESLPSLVFQGHAVPKARLDGSQVCIPLVCVPDGFTVQSHSRTLCNILLELSSSGLCLSCSLSRVRVVVTTRDQRKLPVRFFFGPIRDLQLDPTRLVWPDYTGIMEYTTQKGRALLCNKHQVDDLASRKWHPILQARFRFQWDDAWDSFQARKEAMLIWQLWHKVVAVSVWRGRIPNSVDQSCPMCDPPEKKTVLHRFWSCVTAQHLWTYSTNLLNRLAKSPITSWETSEWS
jgi:hypothetical protein